MDIEKTWIVSKLPLVTIEDFENQSERQIYKTLNLIRRDPEWAIPFILKAKDHPSYTNTDIKNVVEVLKSTQPAQIMTLNVIASQACRQVNGQLNDEELSKPHKNKKAY
mmetsp:Transcript_33090/g.32221  ORF Transcript_33090/g.32221 Transcript_33090/m.32221 type:complete len:109 (+) Transcript_33090:52-378(+)|eukprot:CAMPEP_0170542052 /NCGR_PEP_ID=MMETSP0211-20121228/1603_1 /TAXON_ID=311385 /ORGANISM="Pseudokeronopsis sp., Strain OXSARD2" /LENGTH=108 /DNA_ID=CAMNT_0010844995 /DNA_START=51 /DNA_END=377 /DNA_ORIENTATION=-